MNREVESTIQGGGRGGGEGEGGRGRGGGGGGIEYCTMVRRKVSPCNLFRGAGVHYTAL